MPDLALMVWDSRALGVRAGKVIDVTRLPCEEEMAQYELILARLPMNWDEGREQYQAAGFTFVTIDLSLTARPGQENQSVSDNLLPLVWQRREPPRFHIRGFSIDDSRLMRDSGCRRRLHDGFWDAVIAEHCMSFADAVVCAVDPAKQRLAGMISCLELNDVIEMVLVAVHPEYQSQGIGKQLLASVETLAIETGRNLATQVLVTNVRAMRFYLSRNFVVDNGEIIMHKWNCRKMAR